MGTTENLDAGIKPLNANLAVRSLCSTNGTTLMDVFVASS